MKLQINQIPQRKTRSSESDRGKLGNSLKFTGTGKDFLNRTVMAQALRTTINKWDDLIETKRLLYGKGQHSAPGYRMAF